MRAWKIRHFRPQRWLLLITVVVVALHLYAQIFFSPAHVDIAAYLCTAVAALCSAIVCAAFAYDSQGPTRSRWALVAISLGLRSLEYLGATIDLVHPFHGWMKTLNFCLAPAAFAVFIFALTSVYAAHSRLLRSLDIVLVVTLCVLRYAVEYTRGGIFPNSTSFLAFILIIAIFSLATASIAWLAATDEAESRFARMMMAFCAIQIVISFCCNQLGYLWLNQKLASPWFLSATLGEFAFAFLALHVLLLPKTGHPRRSPSLLAQSAMPFFLALADVFLSLRLLSANRTFGVVGIVLAGGCYAVRMIYLQTHSVRLQKDLLSRNSHLESLIECDPLTGIGNRRSLAGALDRHCAEAFRVDHSVYLLLLDVDGFKQANDVFGHLFGDKCLINIARVLTRELKPTQHHLLRYGGDEFAVVLRSANAQEALRVADYLRCAVHELQLGLPESPLSVSIGVASATMPKPAIAHLVETADRALYRAKRRGRNRVEFDLDSLAAPQDPVLLQ